MLYDFLKSSTSSGTDYALTATQHSTMDSIRDSSDYEFSTPDRSLIMAYPVPGTVALKVYFNPKNSDYYTTIKSPPSGYSDQGTLGYVFTSPYSSYMKVRSTSRKLYSLRTDYRTHSGTSMDGWSAVPDSTFYVLPSELSVD